MSYLVDTDWIIDALRGDPSAVRPLDRLSPDGLAVSIITLGELFEGAYTRPDPRASLSTFRGFLATFATLALTDPIMERFAGARFRLRRAGNLIADMDLLLAATALTHDLTLMTRNARHFRRVPGLRLYEPG